MYIKRAYLSFIYFPERVISSSEVEYHISEGHQFESDLIIFLFLFKLKLDYIYITLVNLLSEKLLSSSSTEVNLVNPLSYLGQVEVRYV